MKVSEITNSYLVQVPKLNWQPVNRSVWNTIQDEGLDEEQNADDFEIPVGNFIVLIDAMSMQYLQGAGIDYKEDLSGSQFVITNPNAETTCGCGSSFSVADNYQDDHQFHE